MTDQHSTDTSRPDGTPSSLDDVGLDDEGVAEKGIADPQQVPMDDAAGGPQAEDDVATDDLSVQGGE